MQPAATLKECPQCSADWPEEPARPSLKGGCGRCKTEYKRRYNGAAYKKNPDAARERALQDYHSSERRFKKYGITKADFEAMFKKQTGCCAICDKSMTESQSHIDHDYTTGHVRGLLCSSCNRALGYFGDNPVVLCSALTYLSRRS